MRKPIKANVESVQEPKRLKEGAVIIWSPRQMVFDRTLSDTQNVVISHGRFALMAMLNAIEYLYACLAAKPHVVDAYLHQDIPQTLTEICLHQGIASNILFNNSARAHNESASSYALRIERFSYISDILKEQDVSTPILSDRKTRNKLIHIDDYLIKEFRAPNTGWFIDIALAYRDQFVGPEGLKSGFCRTFITSEEVILHLGCEISTRSLWIEATSVLAIVFGNPPSAPPEPPAHSRQALQARPPQMEA